ncbi:MAG: repressor LexA [bacterium]|nr:repressor LexA [bacterium]
MSRSLTHQQQAVYDYIRQQILTRGYGPTVREIGGHMNIKSPNGVMCHLRALERKGMITRAANKSRAIELTEPLERSPPSSLPIRGIFQNGIGRLDLSELRADWDVASLLGGGQNLAFQVMDDSLSELSIRREDLLVVRPQAVQAGQLVLLGIDSSSPLHVGRVLLCTEQQVQVQHTNRVLHDYHPANIGWSGQIVGLVRSFT